MLSEQIARVTVTLLALYVGTGVVFAIPFVIAGVNRIDPVARESGWGFRVMILPGAVALWPILLLRWVRRQAPPEERNAHRTAARTIR
jgi:Sec-independent protein secretion pathway component TatC